MMPLLRVRGLTKHFDGLTAVNGVDLTVEKEQIFGIIGPNGAGKTTLFNLLCGVVKISAGEILFNGERLHLRHPHEIARMGIGRTFQIVRPFSELTVLQNVLAAIGVKFFSGWVSLLKRYRGRTHVETARRLLELTDLTRYEGTVAKNLPLGLLRRLEIARALGVRPQLLLLDESFSGLSYKESAAQIDLVHRLRDEGMTILLIEHNMRVAMRLCDRIAVLEHGEKIAEGTPEEIQNDPRVVTAYLGSDDDA